MGESTDDFYVGSTGNFKNRSSHHKSQAKLHTNSTLYNCINNNGGWDNWKIEVIDTIDDDSRYTAEKYWIKKLKPSLNKNRVLPTLKEQKDSQKIYNRKKYLENKDYFREKSYEYRINNPDWYKEYQGNYRKQNREKLIELYRQKYECDCGGRYTYTNRVRHFASKKHANWIESQNEPTISTSPDTGSS